MPVSVYATKKFDYGQGVTPSIEQLWIAEGDEDEAVILPAIIAAIPSNFGAYILQNFSANHIGGGVWEVPVRYGPFRYEPLAPLQQSDSSNVARSLSFTTSGGTQKITQSKGTVNYGPTGIAPPDFKGAIGVNGNEVEGVDIVVPVFNFTWTQVIPGSAVTLAYAFLLADLTGTVNNATWKGFPAKTLRFDGTDGSLRSNADSEIGFKFAYSKPLTNYTLPGTTIVGIDKPGWEYLWIRYKQSTDQFQPIRIPSSAHVSKVYDYTNFGNLGIGS